MTEDRAMGAQSWGACAWAIVLLAAAAGPALAQSVDDNSHAPRRILRLGMGGGAAGTIGSCEAGGDCRELKPTIGFQGHMERVIDGAPVSYGVHFDLIVRNFGIIRDVYGGLDDCRGKECLYLGAFGWLAGTSILGLGPQVTLGKHRGSRPWASLGTSAILYIDPHGDDPGANDDRVIFAHGGWAAAGIDLGSVGLGLRGFWAPKNGILFASDGAAIMSVLGTLEIHAIR